MRERAIQKVDRKLREDLATLQTRTNELPSTITPTPRIDIRFIEELQDDFTGAASS